MRKTKCHNFATISPLIGSLFFHATNAAELTFENTVVYTTGSAYRHVNEYDNSGDYQYRLSAINGGLFDNSTYCSPDCPNNGSKYFFSSIGTAYLSTQTQSLAFDLVSFDIAERLPGLSHTIGITGQKHNGNEVFFSFMLDGINDYNGNGNDFQNVAVPDYFVNLTSLVFEVIEGTGPRSFGLDVKSREVVNALFE